MMAAAIFMTFMTCSFLVMMVRHASKTGTFYTDKLTKIIVCLFDRELKNPRSVRMVATPSGPI